MTRNITLLSTFVLIIFVVVVVVAINNYNNQLQNCKVWKDALTNPENARLSKNDRQIGLSNYNGNCTSTTGRLIE
jgi:hypothetical protein